jgi:GxxExxY protein
MGGAEVAVIQTAGASFLLVSASGEGGAMELKREVARRTREAGAKVLHQELSWEIAGSAMKVHSALGPGLLESVYEECLCHELTKSGISFRRQVATPVQYDGIQLDCGFRLDLLVHEVVIVEIKAVEKILPVHESQLLTYLKITGHELGILINFNVRHLRDGIHRRVMTKGLRDSFAPPLRDFAFQFPA